MCPNAQHQYITERVRWNCVRTNPTANREEKNYGVEEKVWDSCGRCRIHIRAHILVAMECWRKNESSLHTVSVRVYYMNFFPHLPQIPLSNKLPFHVVCQIVLNFDLCHITRNFCHRNAASCKVISMPVFSNVKVTIIVVGVCHRIIVFLPWNCKNVHKHFSVDLCARSLCGKVQFWLEHSSLFARYVMNK